MSSNSVGGGKLQKNTKEDLPFPLHKNRNWEDYGEHLMSQDIPPFQQSSSSYSTLSQPSQSQGNLQDSEPTGNTKTLTFSNSTKKKNNDNSGTFELVSSTIVGMITWEPLLEIFTSYILCAIGLVPSIYDLPFDFLLLSIYQLWTSFQSIARFKGPNLKIAILTVPLMIFACFDLVSLFISPPFMIIVSVFCNYAFACLKYRDLSFTSVVFSLVLVVFDIYLRPTTLYNNQEKQRLLGVIALNVLVHSSVNFIGLFVEHFLVLRDYRALFEHLDHVYGKCSFSFDFVKFLHLPIIAADKGINLDTFNESRKGNGFHDFVFGKPLRSYLSDSPELGLQISERNVFSYSNLLRTRDRLEICVEKVESDTVWISWTTPRSLLMSMALRPVPADQRPHSNNPELFDPKAPLAFALPEIQVIDQGKEKILKQSCTAINGEFQIGVSDVVVIVNGKPHDSIDVHLTKKLVRIRNLQPSSTYTIQLKFDKFYSLPSTCVTDKKEDVYLVTTATSADQEELQKHMTKRAEFVFSLDDEKGRKRDAMSLLKRMKREHPKNLSSAKTELEQLKRSLAKDETSQSKILARSQNVSESIKITEKTLESLKKEARSLAIANSDIEDDLKSIEESWISEKALTDKLEKQVKSQKNENEEIVKNMTTELSLLTVEAGELQERLVSLNEEVRNCEETAGLLDESVKTDKKNLGRLERNIKEEKKQIEKLYNGCDKLRTQVQGDIQRAENDKIRLMNELERERSEVMLLDSRLMQQKETF